MKLFVLSKENLVLAQAEVEQLHEVKAVQVDDNHLLLDVEEPKLGLALTREIHEVFIEAPKEEMNKAAEEFPWQEYVELPYAVEGNNLVDEKEFAGHIWRSLDEANRVPKVNLKQPKTSICLFNVDGKIVVTKRLWKNDDRFFDRRAHLRPRNHPTSLNPKLARAMINLAGPAESILDPFCGSGGILIEGGLAHRSMTGTDIVGEQIKRAEENLAHYGVGATLMIGDATRCDELGTFDAIVTDLPLGKNAKLNDAAKLFTVFFKSAAKCTERIVVAADVEMELTQYFGSWKEEVSFDWFVHKGMIKRIFLLRKL